MELLTAIEELKERSPGESKKVFIRLDRIRERFGQDVVQALKIAGGVDRLLKTKPEHRGILISDFMQALERVREHSAPAVNQ